ncbi:hypothetical protein [Lysobacter fragariae]
MRRTLLCLLIAFASTGVLARESKLSDANGGGCPSQAAHQVQNRAAGRDAAPTQAPTVKKAKVSAQGGGDSDDAGVRMASPRWHRFLPGMFR